MLVPHFINTTPFAARDFWARRGARCFRTGTSAYPSAVCKERATTSGPKRTAARRVASLFGSGFVAHRSQPHLGGCSLVAPRQNRKSTQQTRSYLGNGVLRLGGFLSVFSLAIAASAQNARLASGVRGLATRAPKEMKIDGDLSEFK